MESDKKFKEYMTLLGEKYEKDISPLTTKMIWHVLKPFDDSHCERAFRHVFAHGRFFKDILPDLLERLEGSQKDITTEAWLKVDRAVKLRGNYDSVCFDDPVIHSVIEAMGGWENFALCDQSEWKWKRKEFEGLYPLMARKTDHPTYLPGKIERENLSNGFDEFIPAPAQITGNLLRLDDKKKITAN